MSRTAVGALIGLVAFAAAAVGIGLFLSDGGGSSPSRVRAAYTLVAPSDVSESQLVARAVVDAGSGCPDIVATSTAGVRRIAMSPRLPGPNAAPAFSNLLSCSASLPDGLSSARIGGRVIPAAMPESVRRIGMFADSGCRMDDQRIQNCNDADEWPMAQIAARVAAADPDLILDPGDYWYREVGCPADRLDRCGGTVAPPSGMPFHESDLGWIQEFFDPAQPLFPVAPIAFLRGNHEGCDRGGIGWFLYLDPYPDSSTICDPVVGPEGLEIADAQTRPAWTFSVPVSEGRTLRVAMVDSAYGSDREITSWVAEQRTMYEEADAITAPRAGVETWLETHRPIFAMISSSLLPKSDPSAEPWTSDAQLVASYGLLGHYDMILSSHLHLAQVIQVPGQPASVVIGNGGALSEPVGNYVVPPFGPLAKMDGSRIASSLAPYARPTFVWTRVQYGYAIADAGSTAGTWSIDQYDFDGTRSLACTLADRTISCGAPIVDDARTSVWPRT